MASIGDDWQWFPEARFGLFIHWGAYSAYGRGEQALFRDRLDQDEYAQAACRWSPQHFDPTEWAAVAKRAGMKYAVMTTRHHDGFCLWDSAVTDYSTAKQAARRDFIGEYAEAFRSAGLRVGFYYSLGDWRIPAYWEGPEHDPTGWAGFRDYCHEQVRELLTGYGKIDVIWFDGAWPRSRLEWRSRELVSMIRGLQPEIMMNNRLGTPHPSEIEAGLEEPDGGGTGISKQLGDFGTPEHHITAESGRLWESCQVSTWRLWGHTIGERWRPADVLLDFLTEAAGKGGNLLLNVGPDAEGRFPPEFVRQMAAIGEWMDIHGECIYGSEAGDICEFITYGMQIRKGNCLYLVVRFWDGRPTMSLRGLKTPVKRAVLLTTGAELAHDQTPDCLAISGLPVEPPTPLFPVIKLECDGPPEPHEWAKPRLWGGDPRRMTEWAASRGTSVWADGKPRG